MPISTAFQKRLKFLLSDADFNNSDFSKVANVNSSSLSKALAYGIIPKPIILCKIADYFDVSVPYLLGMTDENDFVKSDRPTSFSQRFENLCEEKRVTHYKVSQECGFDKSNISRWMSKNYLPSLEIFYLLSDYFDVSIDYLLGRTDCRH